jgi:hypothetical protein
MKIIAENNQIVIHDVVPDMGENTWMNLIQQEDGDVIITLHTPDYKYSLTAEFCTFQGGGQHPIIAQKLRELVQELMKL